MCGIAGIFLNSRQDNFIKRLTSMNNVVSYRGPDDEGYMLLGNDNSFKLFRGEDSVQGDNLYQSLSQANISENCRAALGFRRLSIIDLTSAGFQPMTYLNRYCIVFNGEIYNYRELKYDLQSVGYTFNSETDTEVIMAAYDKWGVDCLNKFNGMWAFVLLDKEKNEAIVSRDRYGIKPLYFYNDSERLLFASEIKQFIAYNGLNIEPNIPKIKEGLKSDSKEFTFETQFTNVFRFPNAHYAKFNYNENYKNLNFKKYYALNVNEDAGQEEISDSLAAKYSEEYYSLLTDSVKLRLRSDVNVGTCFSGGLDSSSIVYIVNKLLKSENKENRQKTFSLVFTDAGTNDCDESKYIDSLTKTLDLDSHKIEPTVEDVIQEYKNIVYLMDTPQHSSLMSYIFTYKLVRENGVKVTLEGQGADELQAGYFHYFMNYFSNLESGKILKNYSEFSQNPGSKKLIKRGITFNVLKKIRVSGIVSSVLTKNGFEKNPWLSLNLQLEQDLNENLQSLFHYGDRGSMYSSVESRFPMMDYRLVEFWMKLPVCYKLHYGYTKYIARRAFENKLTGDIVWRRQKFGWEMPKKYWLKKGLGEYLINLTKDCSLIKELGIIPRPFNEVGIKEFLKTANLAIWYNRFFNVKNS